jgi:hypothetical protein
MVDVMNGALDELQVNMAKAQLLEN